jgi:hypothetical protein
MTSMRRRLEAFLQVAYIAIAIFVFHGLVPLASAQSLQITSPKSGVVVAPGKSITVKISVKGKVPQGIGVLGEESLTGCFATQSPYTCSFTVDADTPPGVYTVAAVGSTASDQIESDPIYIDVERGGGSRPSGARALAYVPYGCNGSATTSCRCHLCRRDESKPEPFEAHYVCFTRP